MRLARVLSKSQNNEATEDGCGTAGIESGIELVVRNHAAATAAPTGGIETKDNGRTSMPPLSRRGRLLGSLCFLVALVAVGVVSGIVLASSSSVHKAGDMDLRVLLAAGCLRLSIAPVTACVHFPAFFLAATLLRPAQTRDPSKHWARSLARRGLFAAAALALVCLVAICATFIGPAAMQEDSRFLVGESLCPLNCTCGACKIGPQQNEPADGETWLPTCSKRENVGTTWGSNNGNKTVCPAKAQDSVVTSKFCSVAPGMQSKVALLSGLSSDILRSLTALVGFVLFQAHPKLSAEAIPFVAADAACKKKPNSICPVSPGTTAGMYKALSVTLVPVVCDAAFRYCDEENRPQVACSKQLCCSLCNEVSDLSSCDGGESFVLERLEAALRPFRGMFEDQDAFEAAMLSVLPEQGDEMVSLTFHAFNWTISSFHDLTAHFTDWEHCMQSCQYDRELPPWYGDDQTCFPNENRSFPEATHELPRSPSPSQTVAGKHSSDSEMCACDSTAQARLTSVRILTWVAVFGVLALLGLQISVAIFFDHEILVCTRRAIATKTKPSSSATKHSGSKSNTWRWVAHQIWIAKEQCLAVVVSVFLIASLLEQQRFLRPMRCQDLFGETGQVIVPAPTDMTVVLQNANLDLSWAVLTAVLGYIAMFAMTLPIIYWLLRSHYASVESAKAAKQSSSTKNSPRNKDEVAFATRCSRKVSELRVALDELFSYERGRYYLAFGFLLESIEVVVQTVQLYSFAHERPVRWIVMLSVLLILNGICIPIPLFMARISPQWAPGAKLFYAAVDATFDTVSLLLAIMHSERRTFAEENWWQATLGVVIPAVGIAYIGKDISNSSRNAISSKEWRKKKGKLRQRRRSLLLPDLIHHRTSASSGKGTQQQQQLCLSLCLSLLLSIYSIVTGGLFLRMTSEGAMECRNMLGDAIWAGATPKFVVIKIDDDTAAAAAAGVTAGGRLRGGCNLLAIKSIESNLLGGDGSHSPLVRLPAALTRLSRLRSLVLLGHDIASDGVPARILDGRALPDLTRLEFGENDPVSRRLDLSLPLAANKANSLDEIPSHVLRFMTGLESLQLSGHKNISCFPEQRKMSRLKRLIDLNLSGASIRYLPPSVLFDHSRFINVDLSNTPVSLSLNWSDHGLGSVRLNFSRLVTTLPLLTSLDLSANDLTGVSVFQKELPLLKRLRHLELSQNPDLTPERASDFSWWKVLSGHPMLGQNASFVGLQNVGLGPQHVGLRNISEEGGGITCEELKWVRRVLTSSAQLKLGGNEKLAVFHTWLVSSNEVPIIRCRCLVSVGACSDKKRLGERAELTEAVYFLLLALLPNIRNTIISDVFPYPTPKVLLYNLVDAIPKDMVSIDLRMSGGGFIVLRRYQKNCTHSRWADSGVSLFNNSAFLGKLKHLSKIDLACQGLSGPISKDISTFANLENLILHSNRLTEQIPSEIGQLRNLRYLDLSSNYFSGSSLIPVSIGLLTNLNDLVLNHLSRNMAADPHPIPTEYGALSKLKRLCLSGNRFFYGTIPPTYFNLTNLVRLELAFCNLTGDVQKGISRLTNLNILDLKHNNLRGSIPRELGCLMQLEVVSLGYNNFTGSIPVEIASLPRLAYLDLGGNLLMGRIPVEIASLSRLTALDLRNNQLIGPVPPHLGNLTQLVHLDLSGNLLTGRIPVEIASLSRLTYLDLRNNQLSGPVPPELSQLARLTCC
jgi:Leucine-rich repeat (LRR) protein